MEIDRRHVYAEHEASTGDYHRHCNPAVADQSLPHASLLHDADATISKFRMQLSATPRGNANASRQCHTTS